MPWTGSSFRKKHHKGISDKAARAGAAAANAALESGKSEGAAVRIGNAVANRVGGKKKKK